MQATDYKAILTLAELPNTEVKINYSVEFLLRKNSNYFSYIAPCMIKGINLTFESKTKDIKRIIVVPYLNTAEQHRVEYDNTLNATRAYLFCNDW